MSPDLIYQLALTEIPQIGAVHARMLVQEFGTAEAIFKAPRRMLEKKEGIGWVRAKQIKSFSDFSSAEKEITFLQQFKIQPLFITDPAYPRRLLQCYDAPVLLFQKGEADLNPDRTLAIIGTRSHTDYGRKLTETLVAELAPLQVQIISGLAHGIDGIAHTAACKHQLSTIGVLAHGLDQIYPVAHTRLAKDMVRQGGALLTEFRSGSGPDKHHFPTRNRIVAGMADATVVIETGERGGSMITAELANGYHRDVFAFPGKTTDPKSAGCLQLIAKNKAALITCTQELIQEMGWTGKKAADVPTQRILFPTLSPLEKTILEALTQKQPRHIDELNQVCQQPNSRLAGALLQLELNNLVTSIPGNQYRLL